MGGYKRDALPACLEKEVRKKTVWKLQGVARKGATSSGCPFPKMAPRYGAATWPGEKANVKVLPQGHPFEVDQQHNKQHVPLHHPQLHPLRDIGECTFLPLTFRFPASSSFGGHLGTISRKNTAGQQLVANASPIPSIRLLTRQ
ncbi:hypothetical protein AMTRI_Chr06g197500 [Amborella trichopoda]